MNSIPKCKKCNKLPAVAVIRFEPRRLVPFCFGCVLDLKEHAKGGIGLLRRQKNVLHIVPLAGGKILHRAAGRPIIEYVLDLAAGLSATPPVMVIGHQREAVQDVVGDRARFAIQEEQLGTGHAVLQAADHLRDAKRVLILSGDVPLTRPETLRKLIETFDLAGSQKPYRQTLTTSKVRRIYYSKKFPNLFVIDKVKGGKADALNAGLNLSRYRYICNTDADTIFEKDSLRTRFTFDIGMTELGGSAVDGSYFSNHYSQEDPSPRVQKFIQEIAPYGHPDAPPKLIGKGLNVMLSPMPRNKRARNPHQTEEDQSAESDAAPPAQGRTDKKPTLVQVNTTAPASDGPPGEKSERGFANNPFDRLDVKLGNK